MMNGKPPISEMIAPAGVQRTIRAVASKGYPRRTPGERMKKRTARGSGMKDAREGFRNVPLERLREQRAAGSPAAGVAFPVAPPSEEAIRAAIDAQTCPFCGAGPFKMLPVHTNKSHGIDKWELRELAGLKTTDRLCSADVLAALSEAARRNDAVVIAREANRKGRRPQRWTTAGIAQQAATLQRWEEENPGQAEAARRDAGIAGAAARWGRPG
jgi:hypothetical protein